MSSDKFSGLVRSGSSHSVSVSKHTGNAKNPKNIFHSNDEEGVTKKAPLKKHHAVESNANIQRVESGDSATNVQLIENDQVKENVQHIGIGNAEPNLQELTNDEGTYPNRQAIINESLSDNIQKLGQDKIAANMQQVPTGKGYASNVQAIPVEGNAANQQVINQTSTDANKQTFLNEDSVANNQVIESQANGENRQPTLNSSSSANNAKTDALQDVANKQGVGESLSTKNSQTIKISVPSLNIQSAPEDGPLGVNRKPTDKENLKDHFEVLPSDKLERAQVDVSSLISRTRPGTEQPSSVMNADIPVSINATLAAQQVEKNKRDAYLSRLASIKQKNNSLTSKLDGIEKL